MRNSVTLARPPWFDKWIAEPPRWLEIQSAALARAAIADLDAGEAAAIRLAEQLGKTAFLLMDDLKGRGEATRRGIPSTGTLGVLQAASKKGYLVLRDVLPRLLQTNLTSTSPQPWCSPSLQRNSSGRTRVTDLHLRIAAATRAVAPSAAIIELHAADAWRADRRCAAVRKDTAYGEGADS